MSNVTPFDPKKKLLLDKKRLDKAKVLRQQEEMLKQQRSALEEWDRLLRDAYLNLGTQKQNLKKAVEFYEQTIRLGKMYYILLGILMGVLLTCGIYYVRLLIG